MRHTSYSTLLLYLTITISLHSMIEIPVGFGVAFDTSMAQTTHHNFSITSHDPLWKKVRNLYRHYTETTHDLSHLRIPKIIHRIWLGSPLPEACRQFGLTWQAHHPDWQIILWTEKEIDAFGLQNRTLYDAATNYGEKSDIARYEILDRFGGLYIDTDFECLQSFDYLHYTCDFYTGLSYETTLEAFNGLIGSCPGHPILKLCIQRLKEPRRLADRRKNAVSIIARTGPAFFTESIIQMMNNYTEGIVLFPITYFYPWPWYARSHKTRQEIESWIRPESLAIHHWHVSWQKPTGYAPRNNPKNT